MPIENKDLDENLYVITAPLVGTFYESPKPGEPPFINIGDIVEVGQSLCIIEAMKIFNAIESDYSGEIVEILVRMVSLLNLVSLYLNLLKNNV